MGRNIDNVPEHVQAALQRYDWPGNIRELENVIERAVILTKGPALFVEELEHSQSSIAGQQANEYSGADQRSLEQVELAHIRNVLEQTGWRIGGASGAAAILRLHPNTLRSRMKKLGLVKT